MMIDYEKMTTKIKSLTSGEKVMYHKGFLADECRGASVPEHDEFTSMCKVANENDGVSFYQKRITNFMYEYWASLP